MRLRKSVVREKTCETGDKELHQLFSDNSYEVKWEEECDAGQEIVRQEIILRERMKERRELILPPLFIVSVGPYNPVSAAFLGIIEHVVRYFQIIVVHVIVLRNQSNASDADGNPL